MTTSALAALDRLRLFLRPPGAGLSTSSSGLGFAHGFLKHLYGHESQSQIQSAWEDSLQRIRRVSTIVMGVPSDTGAGVFGGANFGPLAIREAFFSRFGAYPRSVVDVGDIFCVPQLLHDEMLSESQKTATQRELYPGLREPLPVSPLSMTEEALSALYELNPSARVILLGGDQSVSHAALTHWHRRHGDGIGILHFASRPDLQEQRHGVHYAATTFAHRAVHLVKPKHLLQVGIRRSPLTAGDWMEKYPLVQYWSKETHGREGEFLMNIMQHFIELGVKSLYLCNDIEATDATVSNPSPHSIPEPDGLRPNFVQECLLQLRKDFEIIGADIVGVAPALTSGDFESGRTSVVAAEYLAALLPEPG